MPYIKECERVHIRKCLATIHPSGPGEVNYAITRLLLNYLHPSPGSDDPPRYADYNEVVGVLECAKLEFYRRAVAAYEDEKIKENGDVYFGA